MSDTFKYGLIALLLFIGVAVAWWWQRPIQHAPGILIAELPRQSSELPEKPLPDIGECQIQALASFELEGRVLSTRRYWFDRPAKLSPVDVAVGWGPMSDSTLIDRLKIWQGGRFYYWSAPSQTVDRKEIGIHSSNMHLIASSPRIQKAISNLKKGDLIRLQGYLVEAKFPDGGHWRSSLSREDTGDGACEIIWVEMLEKISIRSEAL